MAAVQQCSSADTDHGSCAVVQQCSAVQQRISGNASNCLAWVHAGLLPSSRVGRCRCRSITCLHPAPEKPRELHPRPACLLSERVGCTQTAFGSSWLPPASQPARAWLLPKLVMRHQWRRSIRDRYAQERSAAGIFCRNIGGKRETHLRCQSFAVERGKQEALPFKLFEGDSARGAWIPGPWARVGDSWGGFKTTHRGFRI